MKIEYNSWQEDFKKPFGAIQTGTTVRWAISVDQVIQEAILWLTKYAEDPVAYPMNYNDKTQKFETEVKIGSSGLYHYHFAIKQNDQITFVGKGKFGKGKIINSENSSQFQLTCYDRNVAQEKWYQQGVVYQIFPDRFANGNDHGEITGRKKNSFIYATEEDTPYYIKDSQGAITRWDFYGGNFKGIIKHIPYLKELGITAIYLNPIFLATSNHRYDTTDFMKIDPMLGTEKDFQNLIEELHKNNIHIILDGVFNHVGEDSIYFREAIKDKRSHYYAWFNFVEYPHKYQSWWGVSSLPEVNKNNAEYQDFIYGEQGVLAKWTKLHVDGWRLDVADELPMDFLRQIRKRLMKENCNVLIGEVWEDATNKTVNSDFRPYVAGDNLTGVMNYPVQNFVKEILTTQDKDAEVKAMSDLASIIEHYPVDFLRNSLNNIGTHDTKRIKTVLNEDESLVAIAFGILFMLPGVPCIYYGDEAGLIGDKDPDNRRFYPWKRESKDLIAKVTEWVHFRKNNKILIKGQTGFLHSALGVNAIVRYDDHNILIYCFNKGEQDVVVDSESLTGYCLPENIEKIITSNLNNYKISGKNWIIKKITIQ